MNYVHQELSAFNLISLVENVYRTWRTCMLITCMLIPIFNFKFGRICVQIHAVFSSILLSRLHSSCDSYSCLLGIDVCLDWYFYLFLNPCFSLCCLCIYIFVLVCTWCIYVFVFTFTFYLYLYSRLYLYLCLYSYLCFVFVLWFYHTYVCIYIWMCICIFDLVILPS